MTTEMTNEKFWFLVSKQREWAEMYKIQEEQKKREYREKCKEYQEIMRRQRGVPIRFSENT